MKTAPHTTVCFAALLLTLPLSAATYHVSDREGDDQRNGETAATAWKTLGQAARQVGAGDTVIVHPGVYFESVALKTAGTAEKPIRFTADGVAKNRVILTGARRAIRQGDVPWRIDDARTGLASLKVEGRPARVLADETDLFPYASLDELKTCTLANGVPGPARGFAYDEKEQRLSVRVGGKAEPGQRTMKVAPVGPGSRGSPATYNFGVLVPGAAHVVLEGFTFETPGLCGVFADGGGVTVRHSWFLGCRTGVAGRVPAEGKATDAVTIERCDFSQAPTFADVEEIVASAKLPPPPKTDPVKLPAYYWNVRSGGAHAYDSGIAVDIGARWKILGNYIHDAVDGLAAVSLNRARDVEIAHNTFERIVDSAIETGDRCGRLEAHHNALIDVFDAFSWNPKGGTPWPGPVSFHHNTVSSTARGAKLWAALGLPPSCFELKCDDGNWAAAHMKGVPTTPVKLPGTGLTAYNNTVILPTGDFFSFSGLRYRRLEGLRFLNNLVVTRNLMPERYRDATDLSGMEFDGNLTAPGADGARGPGTRFAGPAGQALDDAAKLLLTNPTRRLFGLRAKSPAVGKGVAAENLPGLSQDVGAHARGTEGGHALAGPVLSEPARATPQ